MRVRTQTCKSIEGITDFFPATLGVTSITTGISVAAVGILAVGMVVVDSPEVWC